MKKRLLTGMICAAMALSLVGCGGGAKKSSGGTAAKPKTLKMSVTTAETSVWHVAAKAFKKEVEEKTGGRYKIQIYGNEQLSAGDQTKGCEMLFNGANDVDLHSSMILSNVVPKLSVVSMPWIFPNGYKSVDEAIFKPGAKGAAFMMKEIEAKGAKPLAIGENGFRQITNNKMPITKPEDLAGMKIRIPAISILMDVFRALKCDPTQMPFSECFTALQQGAIDGQENPYDTIRSAKLQEVQKYMTIWNYCYDPIILSVSGKTWKSLSDADKKIFQEAATKACAAQVKASRALDASIIKEFKDKGMKVNELSPDAIAKMKDAMKPVYAKYKDKFGVDAFTAFGYKF
ncbi:MAG: DctP family TRAP transporter solute-binding subunit [Acidaminococcaceae bacterium]|jgi:tripartite ATP-independent transporter DctP family solute receptor|nr:DctP family TRAP transporter solute-binding subunit [Acidaminococcaceae bacterium]